MNSWNWLAFTNKAKRRIADHARNRNRAVAVETDPDGVVPRQALLLALHAGVGAPRYTETRARWDRFASILAEAD